MNYKKIGYSHDIDIDIPQDKIKDEFCQYCKNLIKGSAWVVNSTNTTYCSPCWKFLRRQK